MSAPRLARRAGRAALFTLGALLVVATTVAAAAYGVSARRLRARHDVPEHPLVVAADSATVARGRHVAAVRGCTACHGAALGGSVRLENALLGRVSAPNLTAGGRGAALTPRDWERAVRHGVGRDGRALLFMPSADFAGIADDDLAAVVAFARSLPPAAGEPPPSRAGAIARALLLAGRPMIAPAEHIDHAAPHPARVAPAPDSSYGAYLATGCAGCHGATFAGGRIPGAPGSYPPAANLTPAGIGRWRYDDFARAMRDGRRPDGSAVRPPMPLSVTRALTDVELRALWTYLRALPPQPTPG